MWTLVLIFAKAYVITATPIEFYSKKACLDAQVVIERTVPGAQALCLSQGE